VGQATLGIAGGPTVTFRVDPESISWNWTVITNVVDTIGGRVIQVIGAYLDDLTVSGSFGQDHSTPRGDSWRQAEAFLQLVTQIMEQQSADSSQQAKMHPPAIFSYPPRSWRFQCYVKALTDAEGGNSIVMTPGKFNQRYVLTLFIVPDGSSKLTRAGTTNGVYSAKAEQAISAYMARISDGIGWHYSQYNGDSNPTLMPSTGTGTAPPAPVIPHPHGRTG
jgi:hypothetical protein